MKAIDKSGREISVGNYIIYGHALGRCAGLKYGKVLGFKETEVSFWHKEKTVYLQIIGCSDDWNIELNSRKSFLQFPESRVLVIEEYQMPKEVLNLLKKYEG